MIGRLQMMSKRQAGGVIITFLVLIFGFSLATLILPEKTFSERENRTLSVTPEVTIESVLDGSFEEDYEDSLTDQFVGRDLWITVKTAVSRLSGQADIHDVYFASDDYLIEKHTGVFDTQTASQNISYLSSFISDLSQTYDSSHLSVMIVPNAVAVLKDKLPAFADPDDETVYLRQIRDSLPEGVWFDAYSVLASHADEEIYYKTDHHWTTYAAFLTYQAWAQKMGLVVPQAGDCMIDTLTTAFEGTIAAKVGTSGVYDTIEYYRPKSLGSYQLVYNQGAETRYDIIDQEELTTRDKYGAFFGGNFGLIESTREEVTIEGLQNTQAQDENSSVLAGLRLDEALAQQVDENTAADGKRRLLVIKDSYAHCMAPFLMAAYDEVSFVDLRYFNQSLSEYMQEKQFTDVLVLCNAAGFAEETAMARLAT